MKKNKFKCSTCEKTFTREDNKNTHEKMHNLTKFYICTLCETSEKYSYKRNVRVHLRKQHFGGIHRKVTKKMSLQIENSIEECSLENINDTGKQRLTTQSMQ